MNTKRGFTLMELMITLAIVAIVLAVGIPSFQEMMRENRLAAQTNAFLTALNLARSEAIKRGRRVTLCASADGATCAGDDGYQQGWIVFVDASNPVGATKPTVDPGDVVLRVYEGLPSGMKLTGNTPVKWYVSFTSDGLSRLLGGGFQAGTLELCAAPKARLIVINSMGRARVAEAGC